MRKGMVFKRCCRCGAAVRERACEGCGQRALSWTFAVDAAPHGMPRRQLRRGGFPKRADARAALAGFLAAEQLGIPWEGAELTTGQYLSDWLAEVASGGSIRPTTAKAYEVAIRVHIVPALGRMPLRQLSRGVITDMYSGLRSRGYDRHGRASLSPKGVHNVHLTLHRALQDAVADRLIPSNPAARAHRMARSRPPVRCWLPAELHRFLAAVAGEPDYAMWRMSASTGLRRGELLGLCWRDIDLEQATVCVQRQLIRNGRQMEFCHPKTPAGRRTICLDPTTISALVAHRDYQIRVGAAEGPRSDDQALVFCQKNGRPRDPDAVSHRFAEIVRQVGLPRIRLHDLRHTHATIALQAAINPKIVQERLGHASVSVTLNTYTHVLPPMHAEAATRIAELVDGVPAAAAL
ncbi:MAG: tyrosine-type recombinase/integrase [Candidatus Dormiibacterota bacterium]